MTRENPEMSHYATDEVTASSSVMMGSIGDALVWFNTERAAPVSSTATITTCRLSRNFPPLVMVHQFPSHAAVAFAGMYYPAREREVKAVGRMALRLFANSEVGLLESSMARALYSMMASSAFSSGSGEKSALNRAFKQSCRSHTVFRYSHSVIKSCTSIASRLRGVSVSPYSPESGNFRALELNSI